MTTIEVMKARAAERKAADVAAVHAAARVIAGGGTVGDVAALESAMAGAGIDLERFDALVVTYRERIADREVLARMPDGEARLAKVNATMEKVAAERERAFAEACKQLARLEAEQAAAAAIVNDGRAARDRLLRDPPGPRGEALAVARQVHRDAAEAAEAIRRTIREERETAERLEGQAADMVRADKAHPDDIADRRRAAGRAARRAAEAEAAIDEADKAVRAALTAVRAAEADALEA